VLYDLLNIINKKVVAPGSSLCKCFQYNMETFTQRGTRRAASHSVRSTWYHLISMLF